MIHRRPAFLALPLLALLAVAPAAPAALAAPVAPAALAAPHVLAAPGALATAPAAQGSGYLRLAHLSPDTPPVDVYVASVATPSRSFTVKGVGYGALSAYQPVQPDTYTVAMRAAGAPADSPPVLSTTLTVRAGAAYTVAGLGKYAELALRVLDDDLTMPSAGQSRVRVVQATTTAPRIDVSVKDGAPVATGVTFAQATTYNTVPAGTWTLLAGPPGQQPVELPVTLAATGVYTVLLVDKGGRLTTELHTDALGTGPVVPTGGVETGLGGAAPPAPSGPLPWLLGAGLALVAAAWAGFRVLVARRPATGRHVLGRPATG
ncbi:MAG TPA: DUF4397 domain-containing protein, partial [Pseudonocardiaceae bacterium]